MMAPMIVTAIRCIHFLVPRWSLVCLRVDAVFTKPRLVRGGRIQTELPRGSTARPGRGGSVKIKSRGWIMK